MSVTQTDQITTLNRIASALERVVQQQDEAVERNDALRQEHRGRMESQRLEDLEAARRINTDLIARMDGALARMDGYRKDVEILLARIQALERGAKLVAGEP